MNILAQINYSKETIDLKEIVENKINNYAAPIYFYPSAYNYGEFISSIGYCVYSLARDIIKDTIKSMDDYFFNLKDRTQRYYSKGYRKREIITIYGHITYYRHEYIDRYSKKPFIYVDEKLGLRRKDRYDPCVCSLIYEKYAYLNSMIKVGKEVGLAISSPYSLDNRRNSYIIPRQTVFKILHRFKKVIPDIEDKVNNTPNTLYVMADEKFIASQGNDHKDLMVKEVIIHEGVKKVSFNRNKLINPRKILVHNEKIFDEVNKYILDNYDIDKIEKIYLMGDGGTWISNGRYELSGLDYTVKVGLDKFHFCKAINSITNDEDCKSLLYEYAISRNKDDFNYLVDIIKSWDELRQETIDKNAKYIINHLNEISLMYKEIKIGYAMEQAISHDITSQFSSVPKAYSNKWLSFYLNLRQNYLNNYDLRKIYMRALDKLDDENSEENVINLSSFINTSIFDNRIYDETYKIPKSVKIELIKNYRK